MQVSGLVNIFKFNKMLLAKNLEATKHKKKIRAESYKCNHVEKKIFSD